MKLVVFFGVFLLSFCAVAEETHTNERDENEIIDIHETDVEMNNAMKKAKDTLSVFLDRFRNPHEGDSEFSLKVRVEDDSGVEHFWVSDIEIKGDVFSGYIANEPRRVKIVNFGQKVNFGKELISDWSYNHNGVRQGSYTLRVLLNRMPKAQAEYYRRQVGW